MFYAVRVGMLGPVTILSMVTSLFRFTHPIPPRSVSIHITSLGIAVDSFFWLVSSVVEDFNSDLANLNKGLVKLSKLLLQSGAEAIYPGIENNNYVIQNETDIQNLPAAFKTSEVHLTAVHLSSACPMGEDKKKCVVDSYGKVHHQKNLYISDSSTMCTAPSVNPQATILALAERNAFNFLENRN